MSTNEQTDQGDKVAIGLTPSVPLFFRPSGYESDGTLAVMQKAEPEAEWMPEVAASLRKAVGADGAAPSAQPASSGVKRYPFDVETIVNYLTSNTHHSTCIGTKRDACVGLGFKDKATKKKLRELCEISITDVMLPIAEDFFAVGNGYMEVVRKGPKGEPTGLHWLSVKKTRIYLDDPETNDFHFVVQGENGQRHFARFGHAEDLTARLKQPITSEVIHFRQPSSLSRWYGYPSWMSAVPCIELVMAILQHNYDFFNNRGVPEFMLFLLGKQVDPDTWKSIQASMVRQKGLGNAYKSLAVNIVDPELKVQLEKLAMEQTPEAAFQSMLDTLSLLIVSGHRVPPLLAGIQIPGKLGANNELPNSMAAFQSLVIGQGQEIFTSTLGGTLGNAKTNGGLGFDGDDAFEFTTILDHMNLQMLDQTSRQRTPVGGAPGQGSAKTSTGGPDMAGVGAPMSKSEDVGEIIGTAASQVIGFLSEMAEARGS